MDFQCCNSRAGSLTAPKSVNVAKTDWIGVEQFLSHNNHTSETLKLSVTVVHDINVDMTFIVHSTLIWYKG
jgi:hypothetical protein